MIKKLTSATEHTNNSTDSIASGDADQNLYPIEFLNNQNPTGLPPHQLKLKVNTPVMLFRNLNPSQGLLNGTRLLIKTLGRRVIQAKIMTSTHAGHIVFIPRTALTTTKDCHLPFTLTRRHFPIKPSYAIRLAHGLCHPVTVETKMIRTGLARIHQHREIFLKVPYRLIFPRTKLLYE